MKKILIDARMYGTKHTGIGRYVKNLLFKLREQADSQKYKWVLLVYQDQEDEIKKDLGNSFEYYPVNIRHYSLAEQLILPWILYSMGPDLVHFTHFNKPVLYFGKSVVTIHDLIKHFSKGKETTTRAAWLYWLKHGLYRLLTFIVIKTNRIIVPSNFWRDYILKTYGLKEEAVTTTHEAVDEKFLELANKKTRAGVDKYVVYTGNLYPHKNVDVILRALKKLSDIKLKIICSRSVFLERAMERSVKLGVGKQVEFLGYLQDEEFVSVYRRAIALVHPAFLEGFSLTGLEAMALDCPVIAANSSCLPEIYGNSVLYFDPNSEEELAANIKLLQDNMDLRRELIEKGKKQLVKYSWNKTAKDTFQVYKEVMNETA